MSGPTDRCIRLSDFVAWRKFTNGDWYANPVTGQVFRTRDGKEISFSANGRGYLATDVRFMGFRLYVQKHRVIWIAAHGLPPYDISMTIDHINGVRTDNRIENLQLITQDENLWKGMRKVSYAQAQEIREKYARGDTSYAALGNEYGLSDEAVRKIIIGLTYQREKDNDPNTDTNRK